ncbi:hypothetical protein [Pseudomonas sp. BF-RE-24]|uniref:hypothetical protein n=1 Tax=Pseudomonas sp. BF-RE-24 TaxID=2832381 RepID=UPI001CBE0D48|nr:hypothetical protein [Pseudomonas sp. BF-RE-24]
MATTRYASLSTYSLQTIRKLAIAFLLTVTSIYAYAEVNISEVLKGRGVWVDSPKTFSSQQATLLKSMGVHRVHFMLTDDISQFNSCADSRAPEEIVSRKKITDAIRIANQVGLGVIVTAYVPPSKPIIDQMLAADSLIASAAKDGAVAGIEYDLEGKWVTSIPCQFQNHIEAVNYLVDKTRELRPPMPVGVTVHYGRLKSKKIGIDRFDWIAAQAYSKCPFKECAEHRADIVRPSTGDKAAIKAYNNAVSRAWDNPRNQPGTMQKGVADRLGNIKIPVIIGLPAYSQYWNKNHTPEEAMRRAREAVLGLQHQHKNYVGENYWSLSNILNTKIHPYVIPFLKGTADEQ